jgi:hypothetical protein
VRSRYLDIWLPSQEVETPFWLRSKKGFERNPSWFHFMTTFPLAICTSSTSGFLVSVLCKMSHGVVHLVSFLKIIRIFDYERYLAWLGSWEE